jgi:hypothetical protein
MSGDGPLLDRGSITGAFRRLGDRLALRGLIADVYVFGGAAMAWAYDARRATRDIDAVFQPHGVVLEEARAVAGELGLPLWWLNEQATRPMTSAWTWRERGGGDLACQAPPGEDAARTGVAVARPCRCGYFALS